MKNIFFALTIIAFTGTACSKNNGTTEVPATDKIDTIGAAVKYTGLFNSAPGESVNGKALILLQNGKYSIALENFTAGNGPDLHLYLSKQILPSNFINIGKLKSINGNQVYALPSDLDFTQYKYALIYCEKYSVLFGSAELK